MQYTYTIKTYNQNNRESYEVTIYSRSGAVVATRAEFGDYEDAENWAIDFIDSRQ